ncbi:MAG: ATP-binding SpoIIE family protein phosphatase [Candidatus Puniceispirillales bacterium]
MGTASSSVFFNQGNGISLITGLMEQYGTTGDAITALRWALPLVLKELNAEAGSLFLHREEDNQLECVVCVGPVDVTGLVVPAEKGLVGRAFTTGQAEIVSDASSDKAHYRAVDATSGFKTVTTATAPVHLGDKRFGSIQAINRRSPEDDSLIINFTEEDLGLLTSLASALALAISNVRLAEKAISDQILQRDLDQATEAQTALMPMMDLGGHLAGKVIPARQLSGDFFDFLDVEGRMAFCQGDVAGKGITAALMMARTIALFRSLARQGHDAVTIVTKLNRELMDVASDRFVTFVAGWFDPVSSRVELINCGHGPVLYIDDETGDTTIIESATVPMGLIDYGSENLEPWQGDLTTAALYMVTDGITEARDGDRELGFDGLIAEARSHQGLNGARRVAEIMKSFTGNRFTTHDDATLLVVTGMATSTAAKMRSRSCTLPSTIESLAKSRAFVADGLQSFGWQDRTIDIQLAVGEVMQNIIRHGFNGGNPEGSISMELTLNDGNLVCLITDTAPASRPETWLANSENRPPEEGGLGMGIIHELTQSFDVEPGEGNNRSRLVFAGSGQDG